MDCTYNRWMGGVDGQSEVNISSNSTSGVAMSLISVSHRRILGTNRLLTNTVVNIRPIPPI